MKKLSDIAVFQDEAAEILGVAPRTMATWRATNEGPTYIRVGRRVQYLHSDLEAYVASKRFEPRS